jgi:trans-aconitate 2-methyltransferase
LTDGLKDWDPDAYGRFRGLRLRPALDLLSQIGEIPRGDIVDLGCGNGAVAGALAARFSGRRLVGVDASATMLAEAADTKLYWRLEEADIADWTAQDETGLIFSNAALQWVGQHEVLLPRLAGQVQPGGMLAVQMPRQSAAPSHRFLRDIAAAQFPGRFDFSAFVSPVWPAEWYWRLLQELGEVNAWETQYVQRLAPSADGHPVRRFTESTAMRPFVDRMSEGENTAFVAAYEEALGAAYPLLPDGSVLMPFTRVFFTVRV